MRMGTSGGGGGAMNLWKVDHDGIGLTRNGTMTKGRTSLMSSLRRAGDSALRRSEGGVR